MEKLTVQNFLVIKEAELDVGRLNFIIGPQASGKSVLAKLLYFFREFLNSDFLHSVRTSDGRLKVEQKGLQRFEDIFPPYTWESQVFSISYQVSGQSVSISNKAGKSVSFEYSRRLEDFRIAFMDEFAGKGSEIHQEPLVEAKRFAEALEWFRASHYQQFPLDHCFQVSQFIPAGRSFFAALQRNIFALLESNATLDPLMKGFGARLDFTRNAINHFDRLFEDRDFREVGERGMSVTELILSGKYLREDGEDWIVRNGLKTNLSNASSAQQEVLPMLLCVVFWPIAFGYKAGTMSFIEEPEAHLFPTAQKEIVELFAYIHNKLQHRFFITTHSPYVLTAVNNLILAKDVAQANPGKEIAGMPDIDTLVAFEDVRAYTIEDGKLRSIMSEEDRLIGSSIIDSVSDEFDSVFDSLLQVQFGG